MTTTTRIGPRMRDAVQIVADCGGVVGCMLYVAERVGPHGSRLYGYQTVHRAIAAGLLGLEPEHPRASRYGAGAVVITADGRDALTD
jgi:hypothetical protein